MDVRLMNLDCSSKGALPCPRPPEGLSGKQQQKYLKDIKLACQDYLLKTLQPRLNQHIESVFQTAGLVLTEPPVVHDTDDADQQTLLVHYPSVSDGLLIFKTEPFLHGGFHFREFIRSQTAHSKSDRAALLPPSPNPQARSLRARPYALLAKPLTSSLFSFFRIKLQEERF